MSTVEIEWRGEERDIDKALDDFRIYGWRTDIKVESIEPDGFGYLMIVISANESAKQFKALVEGTGNADGIIDFLDDWGHVNNWVYL